MAEEPKAAPKAKGPKSIMVVAIRQGFYLTRRIRKGQRFLLREREGFRKPNGTGPKVKITISAGQQFSPQWMVKVDDYKPEPEPTQEVKVTDPGTPSGDDAPLG